MSGRIEPEKFSDLQRRLDELGRESQEAFEEASRPAPELAEEEARFEARAAEAIGPARPGRLLAFSRRWAAAAAVLLLGLLGWMLWNPPSGTEGDGTYGVELRLLSPSGEAATFDGRFDWEASGSWESFTLVVRSRDGNDLLVVPRIEGTEYRLDEAQRRLVPKGETLTWFVQAINVRAGKRALASESKEFIPR